MASPLYLLHRSTANDYSLYEATGLDETGGTVVAVQESLPELERFQFKFVARLPFSPMSDTIAQATAVQKVVFTQAQALREFLLSNLPLDRDAYRLGAVEELGAVVLKSTDIQCLSAESNDLVRELLSRFETHLCPPEQEQLQDPIPDDFLNRILPRLPIMTLLRFRLACKDWERIICDADFVASFQSRHRLIYAVANKKHHNVSFYTTNENQLVLEEPWGKLELEYLSPFELGAYPELLEYSTRRLFNPRFVLYPAVQHCNGLFLIGDSYYVVIYNPSTRELLELPMPVPQCLNSTKKFLLYEQGTKLYKCLHLQEQKYGNGWLDAYVMTVGVGVPGWRKIPSSDGIPWYGMPYLTQAYLDGCLYIVDPRRVLRFDSLSETLHEVCEVPYQMVSKPYFLFVYEGKLAITSLFVGVGDANDDPLCIHTLGDNGWTRMDLVLNEFTAEKLKLCENRGITANDELVLIPLEFTQQNQIHYYNPKTGVLTTSDVEFEGMIDRDGLELHPRALLNMDHVGNHLFFLAKD